MLRLLALVAVVAAVPPGTGPTAGTVWSPARLPATTVDSVYATTVTPRPPDGAKPTSVACVCSGTHTLPPGLTGNKLGTAFGISGVPQKAGTYTFELRDTWTTNGRAFWGRRRFTIVVGKATNAPSDAGMRVGVKATRRGDTLTVYLRDGADSHVSAFTVFPIGLVATKVLSASAGLTCKTYETGRAVECRGGPKAGGTVDVRMRVAGRKSRFVSVEATGRGESTSIQALIQQLAP